MNKSIEQNIEDALKRIKKRKKKMAEEY